jgi:putative hemolysin
MAEPTTILSAVTWAAWVWLGVWVAGFFFSALFSGFETGVYCLSAVRLQLRSEAQHAPSGKTLPSARLVQRMLARRDDLLVGLLIGNNIANYATTAASVVLLSQLGFGDRHAETFATIALTPLLFVFGEMVPKNLFRLHADRLVYAWARPVHVMLIALRAAGFTPVIRALAALPVRLLRTPATSQILGSSEAVQAMLLDTAATGVLTPYQAQIGDNVLSIARVTVRSVMAPLARAVMISSDCDYDDIRALAARTRFSRVAVYRGRDRTQVIGVVNLNEALLAPREGWRLEDIMRPAVLLEADLPVMRALARLRDVRRVMGTVVDRSGRVLGIVTIKDLVEEVVGELTAW